MNFEITSGKDHSKGQKVLIYGPEGIGKTLLAAHFPDPLFIDTEGGTLQYDNIRRLPEPNSWSMLIDEIDFVAKIKPCKTLVIDTVDWAERLMNDWILKKNKWSSIETPGYGKGYIVTAETFQAFVDSITEKLINQGISVVLNCHSATRKFDLPEDSQQFDRYELKLGHKSGSRLAAIAKEWADTVLFCNWKTNVVSKDDGFGNKTGKGSGGKKRTIYTSHSAVYDAKNRFGFPDELPMEWKPPLSSAFERTNAKPDSVKPKPKQEKKKAAEPKPEDPEVPATDDDWRGEPEEWEGLPEDVKKFMEEKMINPSDLLSMINLNVLKNKTISSFKETPQNKRWPFWDSLKKEYESRWKELLDLPF